jgi:hypothetical protein
MTSLERAKQFLKSKARGLALTAVPLAALASMALPAKADVVFNSGFCSGSTSGIGGLAAGGSCGFSSMGSQNGVQGISLSASQTLMAGFSGSGLMSMVLDWGGSISNGSGMSGGSIPVAWLFSVTPSVSGGGFLSYLLTASVDGGAPTMLASGGLSSSGVTTIQGSADWSLSGPSSYDIQLQVTDSNAFGGDSIAVDVPAGSTIDINAAAPEPSSLLLLGPGAALLLLRRRRKA